MKNNITLRAYAKINLGLDVIRKRQDGYHDVCMIMQTINLYDTLTIRLTNNLDIQIRTNLPYLPTDRGNLVYRAAKLFLDNFDLKKGVEIVLDKRIPVAAGLAGGSSDAAATLKGLNELYQTNLSTEELMKLGIQLGADVPYCILMGTALSEGIGEILTPLSPMPKCHILLVKPGVSVSTRYVYENLRLDDTIYHPDISKMITSIEENNLIALTKQMDNILETVTVKNYPVITEIKKKMLELGALTSLMSGSGPTVFGIFKDSHVAETAYQYFLNDDLSKQVFLTEPYFPSEAIRA